MDYFEGMDQRSKRIIILILAVLGFPTLMVGFIVSDGGRWLVFGCVNIILLILCVHSLIKAQRDITARWIKIIKRYEKGELTEEEYQKKSHELIDKI